MAVINYNDFAIKHERILETYSDLEDLEKTKDYLFKNCDILLHEHAQSYMLLSSLEDEMNGKHKRMKLVCRQCQILTHIHELGVSMKRDPRDVILPFFKRIEEATYLQGFLGAVDDFIKKIQKRAVEKRKEMDAEKASKKNKSGGADDDSDEDDGIEYEAVGDSPVGPGGLNPLEVLKQLPKPMRKAFESQDIGRLQEVLGAMAPDEAKHWMKLCVDSGLWVAKDPTVFEGEEEGGDDDIDDGVDA
jgi:cell division cycle protein 37